MSGSSQGLDGRTGRGGGRTALMGVTVLGRRLVAK